MNRFILYIGGPEDTREKSFKTFRIGLGKKATFSYKEVEGRKKKSAAPTQLQPQSDSRPIAKAAPNKSTPIKG